MLPYTDVSQIQLREEITRPFDIEREKLNEKIAVLKEERENKEEQNNE